MADDLPPGFRLDPPAAGGGGDLPAGFKLDEPTGTTHEAEGPVAPTREQEIRRDALKRLMAVQPEPGFSERLKDQVTSGVMRPISGVMSIAEGLAKEYFGSGKPATVGEYYRGGVGAEEDYQEKARENTSKGWKAPLGVAADVAGSLVGGGAATKAIGLGKQMLQSGAQGAIEGASRNASDPVEAAKGAVIGGGIAAGGTGLLGALGDRLGRVKGAKEDLGIASRQGTSQTLEREGSELFTKLDNAGIHFSGKETPELANKTNAALANSAYSRNVPEDVNKVVQEINERVSQGAMTYGDVRKIQTQISNLKAHSDKGVRALAGDLGNAVDDFIHTAKPTMPASSVGTVGPNDLANAKDLWSRGSKASQVEHLAEKGTATSSDPTSKVAKNFEKVVDKARSGKGYSPYANNAEQMALMDTIVQSGPTAAKAAKLNAQAANVAKYGVLGSAGLFAAPSLGIDVGDKTSTTGILGSLALAAAMKGRGSQLASRAARQGTEGVNDLLRNIITNQTAQQAGAYVPRDALAMLLAKQNAARGFGNYLGSFIDKEQPQ